MNDQLEHVNERLFEKSSRPVGKEFPKPIPRSRQTALLSVTGTGCLDKQNICQMHSNSGNIRTPIISGSGNEVDLSLEQLSKNLNAIREEGFSKLSRLVRDLHSEKHAYKQNVDEIDKMIDERVHNIKTEIDIAHQELKDKLKKIKQTTSKKISLEIEQCRKNVRTMNELVQTGLEAFDSKQNDYQILFQLNLEILEKLNYMKSLKNSLQLSPPTFRCGSLCHNDVIDIIGVIEEGGISCKDSRTMQTQTPSIKKDEKLLKKDTDISADDGRSNRRVIQSLAKYGRQNSQ